MSTPYETVYDRLLSRIRRDEDWDKLNTDDVIEDIVALMDDAIPLFLYPREDLTTRDDTLQEFTATLENDTTNVLAEFMFAMWVKRKSADTTTMSQMFHSNDLKMYSQANHLKEIQAFVLSSLAYAKKVEARYYKASDGSSLLSTGLAGEL